MRKFLIFIFSAVSFLSFAEDVEIIKKGAKPGDRFEAPVDVDITGKLLGIGLTEYGHLSRYYAHVVVTGPEGVVFEADISSDNRPAIIVDLNKYMEGGYTVTFFDREGNVISGDFLLQ